MGVVYEAMHLRLRQRVAIKMLLPEMMSISDVVSRFEREARAAGQLRGDNAARVLDVETTASGIPYMVMEFLDGHDLSDKIVKQGRLPIPEAVDYVLQACNAMKEAHRLGIVHRDLKPDNLFLRTFLANIDGRVILKVLDFGISKVDDEREARVTGTQATVGTPLYMSPEQIRSAKHVDSRTDIWSLGIILYELLIGKTPYEGSTTAAAVAICIDPVPTIRHLRPDVPPGLEAIIMKALAKERVDRYPSVEVFGQALIPYASATGVAAMGSQPSMPSLSHMTAASIPPSQNSDELLWGARTEMSSADALGAKRPGAGTAGSWSTQSGQRKKRASPALIAATAGIMFALGIAGVVIVVSHFSGPKVATSADPARVAVGASVATSAVTTDNTLPTLEPSSTLPTTQFSSLPMTKTAPTPTTTPTPTVRVRPPTTGATGTGSTKPTPSVPPTNTNAPAHI